MTRPSSTAPTGSPQTPYHHGNLKEALVEAFLHMLEAGSADKISMRKLASHIGVAPTAVYNHFESKDALLIAVKTRCLNHFADYLDQHAEELDAPSLQIRELGKAYFNYSLEHRQFFKLIMGTAVPEHLVSDALIAAGMRAEAALRNAVCALLEENGLPTSQYNEGLGAFACWSISHGISVLVEQKVNHVACADGRWPAEFMLSTPDQVHQSFDAMTDILVSGILSTARLNPAKKQANPDI